MIKLLRERIFLSKISILRFEIISIQSNRKIEQKGEKKPLEASQNESRVAVPFKTVSESLRTGFRSSMTRKEFWLIKKQRFILPLN